jgi:hypothetical protein
MQSQRCSDASNDAVLEQDGEGRTEPAAGGGKGAASALSLASNSPASACGACSSLPNLISIPT